MIVAAILAILDIITGSFGGALESFGGESGKGHEPAHPENWAHLFLTLPLPQGYIRKTPNRVGSIPRLRVAENASDRTRRVS